jgi:hypothetical protein
VLPPGSAIEQMLADYQVMRDQARACGRFGKLAAPAASSAESAGNTVNFADRRAAAGGDAGGRAPAAHGSCGVPV